jgi:hypothetical protein
MGTPPANRSFNLIFHTRSDLSAGGKVAKLASHVNQLAENLLGPLCCPIR